MDQDMTAVPTTPVTLGSSRLGERPGGPALADALLASPLGSIDTSNMYADGRSEALLGDAIGRAGGIPNGKLIYSKADRDLPTGVFDGDWESSSRPPCPRSSSTRSSSSDRLPRAETTDAHRCPSTEASRLQG